MPGARKFALCFLAALLVAGSWDRSALAEPSVASRPISLQQSVTSSDSAHQAPMEPAPSEADPDGRTPLGRALSFLAAYHNNPLSVERAEHLAALFYRYGRRWGVNPYLVASIACQESIFRSYPRKVRVRRCRTVIRQGRAETLCENYWAGERGMMQVIPSYVREGYRLCTGRRRWRRLSDLTPAEVNVCVGAWLLARKRKAILDRMRRGKGFIVRGAETSWRSRYAPCSRRHRHFCEGDNAETCRRYWWVASYNWGSHQLLCGPTARGIDFTGYPIRVLGRLAYIWKHFAPARDIWSSPEDYEFSRLLARGRPGWLTAGQAHPRYESWVGLRVRRMDRLFELVRPDLW